MPASWRSWPPASTGRPPPGVHRSCPLLGLLGRRRVRGEKAQERRVVGAPPPGVHRTCPLLGLLGRRPVRGAPPSQGCTALARFLAFLAAGEYGARRRKNGALSAPPPRGAPPLPASWPSWPPASMGREGACSAPHWSRYELHNRTSIHSKKLIITISPPRSNNTANSLAKSINLIMKALITRRPGYELSYESHNEANSGLIARDQSETSR